MYELFQRSLTLFEAVPSEVWISIFSFLQSSHARQTCLLWYKRICTILLTLHSLVCKTWQQLVPKALKIGRQSHSLAEVMKDFISETDKWTPITTLNFPIDVDFVYSLPSVTTIHFTDIKGISDHWYPYSKIKTLTITYDAEDTKEEVESDFLSWLTNDFPRFTALTQLSVPLPIDSVHYVHLPLEKLEIVINNGPTTLSINDFSDFSGEPLMNSLRSLKLYGVNVPPYFDAFVNLQKLEIYDILEGGGKK